MGDIITNRVLDKPNSISNKHGTSKVYELLYVEPANSNYNYVKGCSIKQSIP